MEPEKTGHKGQRNQFLPSIWILYISFLPSLPLLRILLLFAPPGPGDERGHKPSDDMLAFQMHLPSADGAKWRTWMGAVTKQNQAIGSLRNSPVLLKFSQQKFVLPNHYKKQLFLPPNISGSMELNHPTQTGNHPKSPTREPNLPKAFREFVIQARSPILLKHLTQTTKRTEIYPK